MALRNVESGEEHLRELRLHVRRIREDIEARGVPIDDDVEDGLMHLLEIGREAIARGHRPVEAPDYRAAAVELQKVVNRKKAEMAQRRVPQVTNRLFTVQNHRVGQVNQELRDARKVPPSAWRLVDMANKKAKSEEEFVYLLREIERSLKANT